MKRPDHNTHSSLNTQKCRKIRESLSVFVPLHKTSQTDHSDSHDPSCLSLSLSLSGNLARGKRNAGGEKEREGREKGAEEEGGGEEGLIRRGLIIPPNEGRKLLLLLLFPSPHAPQRKKI